MNTSAAATEMVADTLPATVQHLARERTAPPECQSEVPSDDRSAIAASKRAKAALACVNALQAVQRAAMDVRTRAADPAAAVEAANDLATLEAAKDVVEENVEEADARLSFLGYSWGFGIGYGFGRGPARVADAELVNDVVRIKDDVTDAPRVVIEAHHFFELTAPSIGIGPFGAVQVSTDGESALAFALGVMFGFKDPDSKSNGSWNVGIGYEYAGSVKTLGDGITANEPLPDGETQVRYKNTSAGAVVILFSRQFKTSSD